MIKSMVPPSLRARRCYLTGVLPTSYSGSVVFVFSKGNSRSTKMRGIKCVSAGFAALLLGLSSPQTMAQGQLTIEPHPFDSIMSPYPLGPLQKFGGFSPGYVGRFSSAPQAAAPQAAAPPAAAPQTEQAKAAPDGQLQTPRRQSARAEPRQLRASARRQEARRTTIGVGTVLSLAPRYGERPASTPFCFPSSTVHFQQDARCNLATPAYRGRFEELLGE
jgi:hypothetical protein